MPHDVTRETTDSTLTHHDATRGYTMGNDLLIRRSRVRNSPGSCSYETDPANSAGDRAGRYRNTAGYVMVLTPGHPHADRDGYVREHVLLVARAVGHALHARVQVHHVDESKANNAPSNLVACEDAAYHMLLHQRQRAFDACGNPGAIRCGLCAGYDRQDEMTTWRRPNGSTLGYHRDCRKRQRSKGTAKLSICASPAERMPERAR